MRAVVQRVNYSSVEVDNKLVGEIHKGYNVLLGVSTEDTIEDAVYLRDKIVNLRVFEDEDGKMNRSLLDVQGELLIVSQFTLYGDCRKGRRPSFVQALGGDKAKELYEYFLEICKEEVSKVEHGIFGADMKVTIENSGPVTILIDSKKLF
ncbi:D-tyrosyl-tRNA(Tyr) deacylase [Hathewaya proteolytica DSM 3090]|uniref:D-aminoacyl-tRNA deacylase n=1 Tax=Hathewaya proteolytica DSM 3090 TaxID=1121331 RepID=A0A1M6P822_9CLOT|nr:D-aminoacyl-tRNA deacylase [Hathewaya proteolytica]SHK04050.1 D-tyrosyl-tRNA(Tyr) deacylase [Hathewaya proteolytica DSM 3090]